MNIMGAERKVEITSARIACRRPGVFSALDSKNGLTLTNRVAHETGGPAHRNGGNASRQRYDPRPAPRPADANATAARERQL
ncbi:hypothetical protein EVAR_45851_1 [Eumeta japonica]|uniref:Uncharacterized protein n=1 Tax=Eumeta variegata TaxID=151549 RepID=A0A4C1WNC1_EUMVA|nr:hypothetical protein EVAR_45851_1 [Eumeta japonica]